MDEILKTFEEADQTNLDWEMTELVRQGKLNPEPVLDLMSENPFVTKDNLEIPAYARRAVNFI